MPTELPLWVTVITALIATGLIPLGKLLLDYSKQKWDVMRERDRMKEEDEDEFLAFLKVELEKTRGANNACEEKYRELSVKFTRLSARCARLEAVMIHLHPEIAEELLKEPISV